MPSYLPAKKNTEYVLYLGLPSVVNGNIFQVNPTIAAGDFKVSIDGGALNNLAALPTVTPAGGKMVKVTLALAEMNGDNIQLVCSDAAGNEWKDVVINIPTSANQIDDMITLATNLFGSVSVADHAKLMDAMVHGKFAKDEPLAGQITFYEDDDTTPIAIVDVTATGRLRVL